MTPSVASLIAELARVEDEVRWASLRSRAAAPDASTLALLSAREDAIVRQLRSIDVSVDLTRTLAATPA